MATTLREQALQALRQEATLNPSLFNLAAIIADTSIPIHYAIITRLANLGRPPRRERRAIELIEAKLGNNQPLSPTEAAILALKNREPGF
ncbi:hypothetical protein A2379_00365 [Candidatus Amesbacteria bacterium RIFOXYB1_FULL_47_13]|nr:MAG: hypothetical protein UW51_C0006G0038 [Candidatus Amesbacteria bacterium GW2011_GWA1_44_24]OGD05629.1 MAG: hypothetical protein A2379_00365 [Candidatus Amesbacteria bacterium RIFOXYB1_FULL_47_13]HBC72205.1 hypothetical protein [Candidatus Amesbacteria bacterium]